MRDKLKCPHCGWKNPPDVIRCILCKKPMKVTKPVVGEAQPPPATVEYAAHVKHQALKESVPRAAEVREERPVAPAIAGATLMAALAYLTAIAGAELITALVNPLAGIGLHILLLLGLVGHASLDAHHPRHKLYLALALAPLIRLLSLSLPLANLPQIYWYAIIAAPLLLAVFVTKQRLGYNRAQVGLTVGKLPLQLLVGATGILFGMAEFYILQPEALADSVAWDSLLAPALILLVATGFTEEICFRGVMQHSANEALGRWGWVYIAMLFASLHIGYLLVSDVAFVLLVGIFFGWVVNKTGSLLGVTLSHGITNIILYLVAPLLLG